MKKIGLLIIAFLFFQCKAIINEENEENSTIQVDDELKSVELVGAPFNKIEDREKELNLKFEFLTIEKHQLSTNNNKRLELIVEKIKDWNDPGDFHKIRIRNQKEEFVFFNSFGWVSIGAYQSQFIKSFSENNEIKSSSIYVLKASEKDILLFAFGYVYGSQPGLLSIINLSRYDEPILIFNDNFNLYSLEDLNGNGVIDIIVTKLEQGKIITNNDLKTYFLKNGGYQTK